MIPERLAYLEAREKAAFILKEKYGFRETFRDNEILTLDNTKCSIHLTLQIPDDVDVYLTLSGQSPSTKTAFLSYLLDEYLNIENVKIASDELFKEVRKEKILASKIYLSFMVKINYLLKKHSDCFVAL